MANQKTKSGSINPLETLKDLGSNTLKSTANTVAQIGSGIVNELIGYSETKESNQKEIQDEIKKEAKKLEKRQGGIFNWTEHYENVLIKREIQKLTEQIRQQIVALQQSEKSLLNDVKDVEKLVINDLPEKPGVYHIRFLEIVLSILKSLQAKVSESRTWLQALISKKKKRGSLFVVRSKKMGTQYSLSQELSLTRATQ